MSRRNDLRDRIQALSREEGQRQPTAAAWLKSQDEKARHRRDQGQTEGTEYKQSDESDDLKG
ncbi:hypothetical protein [Variovorax sp. ZT4R33]|uniref:hypothetical protein n=1 Tax=Variovorax sp. ZT4R33 TaxID=3443743 RepID=UPI003F463073